MKADGDSESLANAKQSSQKGLSRKNRKIAWPILTQLVFFIFISSLLGLTLFNALPCPNFVSHISMFVLFGAAVWLFNSLSGSLAGNSLIHGTFNRKTAAAIDKLSFALTLRAAALALVSFGFSFRWRYAGAVCSILGGVCMYCYRDGIFQKQSRLAANTDRRRRRRTKKAREHIDAVLKRVRETLASDAIMRKHDAKVDVAIRLNGRLKCDKALEINAVLWPQVEGLLRHSFCDAPAASPQVPFGGTFNKQHSQDCRVRVSIVHSPQERCTVALRFLHTQSAFATIRNVTKCETLLTYINEIVEGPSGLVLFTGAAGAGKTTTIYAVLRYHATLQKKGECEHIVSIEDPVEDLLPSATQIQVETASGLDFSNATKAVVRQCPDVLMIGEIRDQESALTAVQMGFTGHTVFATMHSGSIVEAIGRLESLGLSRNLISGGLRAVVHQCLVPVVCEDCHEDFDRLHPKVKDLVEGLTRAKFLDADDSTMTFRAGNGCDACHYAGENGRTAIFETLLLNDKHRQIIRDKAPESLTQGPGYTSAKVYLKDLIKNKHISPGTALATLKKLNLAT